MKREAEDWLQVQNTRRDRGDWVDPSHAAERFETVAMAWLDSRRDVADSTLARDRSYLTRHVVPYLGDHQLREVTVETLDRWVAGLSRSGLAPATVRKVYQLASMVLDRAVALRKLPANPAHAGAGVTLPAAADQEMRFLTVDEADQLAAAIDPWYSTLVHAGVYTGARWGELAGLKAKRLDLDAGRMTVAETLSEVNGSIGFKAPKTAASRRTVALPGRLVDVLRAHLVERPAVGDGLVFTDSRGNPLRRSNFRRRTWTPAVVASVGRPMRFHDLRHTHAALLIANGEHPKTIQTRLGHASITTTLDRYGHLMEGLDTAAAARLDSLAGGAGTHSGSTGPTATVTHLSARK